MACKRESLKERQVSTRTSREYLHVDSQLEIKVRRVDVFAVQVADTRSQQRCSRFAHEHLRLGVVGQLGIRDDTQTGFSAFQSSEFDLDRNTSLGRSSGMSSTLQRNVSVCVHCSLAMYQTYLLQILLVGVCVTGVHHDRIERGTSLSKRQRRIDILLGRRVIQVDSNRHRSRMCKVNAERQEWLTAPV